MSRLRLCDVRLEREGGQREIGREGERGEGEGEGEREREREREIDDMIYSGTPLQG